VKPYQGQTNGEGRFVNTHGKIGFRIVEGVERTPDGLVVVPREDAAVVLEHVPALEEREKKRIATIKGGELFKAEIDETL